MSELATAQRPHDGQRTGPLGAGSVRTKRPPTNRHGAHTSRRRVAAWAAALTSAAVFLVSGTLYAGYATFDGNLARVSITAGGSGGSAVPASVAATHPAINVLLVGLDDRSNLTEEQLAAIATEEVGTALTDTIILAHLPAKSDPDQNDQAVLMSIPRDAWVRVPGQGSSKINSVHMVAGGGESGARALVETVEEVSGLRIDHYVQVDLNGFVSLSDAVGGVEVCLKQPVDDDYTQLVLPAGPQVLQGADALKFVRQRHGLPRGDLDRIVRQQAFLSAALRKVTSAGTLLNPLRVNALLRTATDSLVVDEGLTVDTMRDLAFSLRDIAAGNVEFRTIPVLGLGREDGQSVVRLDTDALPGFFGSLDELAPEPVPALDRPAEGAAPLTVPTRDVSLVVRNGSGVDGAASRAVAALEDQGFVNAGTPSNADRTTYVESVVRYGPGAAESAITLSTAVAGSRTEFDARLGSDLVLVLGANYSGVREISVPGDVSPPPPAGADEPQTYQARFADDTSCVN